MKVTIFKKYGFVGGPLITTVSLKPLIVQTCAYFTYYFQKQNAVNVK
jgi:hypothetical protein